MMQGVYIIYIYIKFLKMNRITQPKEGDDHPRWERKVMLREGLQVYPKNLLWEDRGCKDENLNHIKQIEVEVLDVDVRT